MTVASSKDHLAERVARYVDTNSSLSDRNLNQTLNSIFGDKSKKIIIGGLVRDLARGGITNRQFDVDVVLDMSPEEVETIAYDSSAIPNRFGGFGTLKDGWKIDYWALSTTWAHRSGYSKLYFAVDIIDTTFFNVDAVAFDIKHRRVYMHDNYLDDLRDRLLEIELEPNPSIAGNLVRAVRRLKMWNYRCGPKLASFLKAHVNKDMFDHIVETELKLYGKSYADQYDGPVDMLYDLIHRSSSNVDQLEFKL